VPFVNAELNRHGVAHRIDPTRVLDPLVFVRWHHRDWRARRLDSVAQRMGFPIDKAHSAAADAEAAARVLWRLLDEGLVPPLLDDALAAQARFGTLLEEEWRRFGHNIYLDRADGRPRVGFGAHCGKLIEEVDQEYLRWCLGEIKDLTAEARGLIEQAAKTA
jgi:DNA polymerase III epsilon subunit-like protein